MLVNGVHLKSSFGGTNTLLNPTPIQCNRVDTPRRGFLRNYEMICKIFRVSRNWRVYWIRISLHSNDRSGSSFSVQDTPSSLLIVHFILTSEPPDSSVSTPNSLLKSKLINPGETTDPFAINYLSVCDRDFWRVVFEV